MIFAVVALDAVADEAAVGFAWRGLVHVIIGVDTDLESAIRIEAENVREESRYIVSFRQACMTPGSSAAILNTWIRSGG